MMRHWNAFLWACCLLTAVAADDNVQSKAGSSSPPLPAQATSRQLTERPVPLVIAHRGASGYLPEHTIESAVFAHALGSDFIEQDVVLTRDGHAAVLHDVTLDQTTNVADVFPDRQRDGKFYVFDFTLAELKQLSVRERFGPPGQRFPRSTGQFHICTLSEQIEVIQGLNQSRQKNTGLYVEIKRPDLHRREGLDPSREVLRILEHYHYKTRDDGVFIQCFDAAEIHRLRTELKCRLSLIQLLSDPPTDDQLAEIGRVADGVGVALDTVISGRDQDRPVVTSLVSAARQHALQVHVWTLRADDLPNYADSTAQLLQWLVVDAGVDGIFTDHPDLVLDWRRQSGRERPGKGPFHLLQNRTPANP